MSSSEDLKKIVKEKYGQIAHQDKEQNAASCCGATDSSNKIYSIMMDDYSELEGYNADADLGLGCGLPTQFAMINKGDTVVDLGSGAGNDCFVARHEAGIEGKVIGIDFTDSMIDKARTNAEKLSYNNIEFRKGDIEDMPISDKVADVVISNCVLNLVPNKEKVISEIYRILKPGGHFSISDIVLKGDLPEALKSDAEMYAGCVAGAIQKEDYLNAIEKAGFKGVSVQKEKSILLPDDILIKYLSQDEIESFKNRNTGIYSVTVFAQKPGIKSSEKKKVTLSEIQEDCTPGGGCC
jgi:arsenite methyltransferase